MLPSASRCQNSTTAWSPLAFIQSEADFDLIVFVVFDAVFTANVLVHASIVSVIWPVLCFQALKRVQKLLTHTVDE